MLKYCPRCWKDKDLEAFHKNIGKPLGRATYCKVCMNIINRARKNTERYKTWKRKYEKQRRENNPSVKINDRMRNAINDLLRNRKIGTSKFHWETIIGYTVEDLMCHLENQFVKGMSWANYGVSWHIDHILPLASFEIYSVFDDAFKRAWELDNLQPLWATQNMSKGSLINVI